uniref:F-box domain-containing protein n=1 Tax=Caenorhabditis japonica TaxID=281687 RepID=A0A8R1DL24_CAEJA
MEYKTGTERLMTAVLENDLLMATIVGKVESFKDRNSLELVSRRFRMLCLKTPITRRERYAIRLEQNLRFVAKSSSSRSINPQRPTEMTFSVTPCSDVPEEDNWELVRYECRKGHREDAEIFFQGVRKRMLKQIFEFESINRVFGMITLKHIEQLPKLKGFIFRNSDRFLPVECQENELNPESSFVADRVESLTIILDNHCSHEIYWLKSLIGPGLKHLSLQVTPNRSDYVWFLEEVMMVMARHKVHLDTCQLMFSDPRMPRHLVVALTYFMSERSKVMRVFVLNSEQNVLESTWKKIVPTVSVQFCGDEDTIVKQLVQKCPRIFQMAEVIHLSDIHAHGFKQIATHMLPHCFSTRKLFLENSSKTAPADSIDQLLSTLPTSSLDTLSLHNCKISPSSMDFLVSRLAQSLRHLSITGTCASSPSFVKALNGLDELQCLVFDTEIPHLLFPKIAEHRKLEEFVGKVDGNPPEKSLQVLRDKFRRVELVKNGKQQRIMCKNRIV